MFSTTTFREGVNYGTTYKEIDGNEECVGQQNQAAAFGMGRSNFKRSKAAISQIAEGRMNVLEEEKELLDALGPIDFRVLAEIYRDSLIEQGEAKAAKEWEKLAAKISKALSPTA